MFLSIHSVFLLCCFFVLFFFFVFSSSSPFPCWCSKVRHPVICVNNHVFCSICIEVWLKNNNQCPACRIPITPENPCKEIIGKDNLRLWNNFLVFTAGGDSFGSEDVWVFFPSKHDLTGSMHNKIKIPKTVYNNDLIIQRQKAPHHCNYFFFCNCGLDNDFNWIKWI